MNIVQEFTESLNEIVKQTGGKQEQSAVTYLKAGKLRMAYSDGILRYISVGENELIRMIYPAVRGKNWLTVNPIIENENIETKEDSFRITLICRYTEGEISFSASFLIEGNPDSSFSFTLDGNALESFEKNRIGFCVLHPLEGCVGKSCVIGHSNGSIEHSAFPEEISPQQVFMDIKSMNWQVNKGYCTIDFEGDIFETEDHRNWTDSSFKTYSTPLSIPYPVRIEKGTHIFQKVKFRYEGSDDNVYDPNQKTIVELFPEETFRLPSIGICQSGRSTPLSLDEVKVIRALRFDHYRVDLHLYKSGWQFKAEQGCQESFDFGYSLELALFFDDHTLQQINNFMDWYSRRKLSVSSILLFHISLPSTHDKLAREVITILRGVDPDVKIITGTNANFAQLNRNTPGDTGNDHICYSIHPQEHASDNTTLAENLEAQKHTIKSAKKLAGDKGIVISPVTIQRRFNANVSYVELPQAGKEIHPQVDSRLMSLLGACWTAGSLKYICENGVQSVTYYETVGERGIFQGEQDSQWPDDFKAIRGMIFPVFHVFRYLLGHKDLKLIKSKSSRPLVIECLALTDGKQARIMLMNFSGSPQTLQLECCSGLFRIRTLNAASFSDAALNYRWTGIENERTIKSHSSFELDPYSINFIEGWRKH